MITITIHTENAAFSEAKEAEIARILRRIADNIEDGRRVALLLDSNGNICGKVILTGTDKPKRTRRI